MPKISELSAASALAGTELVPVVQGAATVKTTVSALRGPNGSQDGVLWNEQSGSVALEWVTTRINLTLIDNVTLTSFTFPAQGRYLLVVKALEGEPTLTWPEDALFAGGAAPVLSAFPGGDVYEVIYSGFGSGHVVVLGQNFT